MNENLKLFRNIKNIVVAFYKSTNKMGVNDFMQNYLLNIDDKIFVKFAINRVDDKCRGKNASFDREVIILDE